MNPGRRPGPNSCCNSEPGLPVSRGTTIPLRGQYDLYNALRYVTEGYAGIHLNKMHGLNIDFGILNPMGTFVV